MGTSARSAASAASESLPEHFPFWDWSLAIYARAGVAEACLALQDRRGVDVNLILFAIWLAVDGRALGNNAATAAAVLDTLAGDARRWQVEMVQPLRSCRRAARSAGAALPSDALERFRDAVKALELDAERHEQWLLFRAAVSLPHSLPHSLPLSPPISRQPPDVPDSPVEVLARRHLGAVAIRSGITWTRDDLLALDTLVSATCGDGHPIHPQQSNGDKPMTAPTPGTAPAPASAAGSSLDATRAGTRAPATADPTDLPLAGLSVIELQAIGPVPFAGLVLRQLGAQVTRVVAPVDPGRGIELDPRFDLLNAGKTEQVLDLKTGPGRDALAAALANADVLIEGFRPGVLERLGFAPAALLARHPRLVIGRLSGWGDRGSLAPTAGHDINYLALAGVLDCCGPADRPIPPMNLVADFGGGAMYLVTGVLARLVRRGLSGQGGLVTTSILAGTVGLTPFIHGLLAAGRWQTGREANLLDGHAPFYRTYACADGRFIAVGALEAKFYRQLLEVTGLAGQVDAARQYDEAGWPALTALFAARFAERSRDDWARVAAGTDACLSPVLDLTEATRHPHNLANDWYDEAPGFAAPTAAVLRFNEAD